MHKYKLSNSNVKERKRGLLLLSTEILSSSNDFSWLEMESLEAWSITQPGPHAGALVRQPVCLETRGQKT